MAISKIFSTVTKMFNIFDRYGAKVELKFDGDTEVKNFIGAFVSLFSIFLSLYLSYGTLSDFLNKTNPKLTTVAAYDNYKASFSTDNLFFSISFFSPNSSSTKSRIISSSTNNLTATSYIHPLSIQCTDCAGMTTKEMNMCSGKIWDEISLKSMSSANSNNVLSVFRNYSYCLPDNYNGTLADNKSDNDDDINPQDSTLQFYIPFSKTPVNFNSMPQNSAGLTDNTKLFDVSKTSNPTATVAPTPVVNPNNNNSNQPPNNNNSNQPPNNNNSNQPPNNNNSIQQPNNNNSNQQPNNNNSNQQPNNNNSNQQPNNNNSNQPPNNNNSNQQPNNNNSNQPPTNNPTQPTSPTNNPTQPTSPTNNPTQPTSPTNNPTQPTSPTNNPTQPTSPTNNPFQPTSPTTNPTQPTSPTTTNPPSRLLQALPSLATIDNPDHDPVQDSYRFLVSQLKDQKFPKILLIHRDMEINQSGKSSNIGTNVYKLKILDYKEPILDNPYLYDVNVKQISLKIVKQGFLTSTESSLSYLSIDSITPNKLSSSENDGAYLSFKLMSDSLTITVTYVAFTDFLGDFGAYFATTEMLAAVVASLFSEHFLKKRMVNSLFKFVMNEPSDNKVFTKNKSLSRKEFHNLKNVNTEDVKKKEYKSKEDMNSFRSYDPILNNKTKIEEMQAKKVDNLFNALEVTPIVDEKPYIIIDDFILEKNELLELESKISREKDLNKKKDSSQTTGNILAPLYDRQEIEMVCKKLEKQREKERFDENVKQILEIRKLKKQRKTKYEFTNMDLLIMGVCGWKCNKKKEFFKQYRIFNKCNDIIEDISDLKYQKSVVMQLNLLKKFIFNKKEIFVFNSLEKRLNLLDCDKTRKYLKDAFKYSSKFKSEKYFLLENQQKSSKQAKLLDEFLSVLSF
jgi:hypothetical protein